MKKIVYFAMIAMVGFSACKKEETKTNNDSILTKANIEGQVRLFDEYGQPVSDERMLVIMEGNGFQYTAETERDGSFLLQNIPYFHNYTISYMKTDFGTYKAYNFNHEYTGYAGKIEETPNLSQKSTAYCMALLTNVENDTVNFQVSVAGGSENGLRKFRILFHTIPAISNEVYSIYTHKLTTTGNTQTIRLSKEALAEYGLESGLLYYAQVYGDSYYSNAYEDDYNLKHVLPNLGFKEDVAVPTTTFVMP